jgi:hypothetical protein
MSYGATSLIWRDEDRTGMVANSPNILGAVVSNVWRLGITVK